MRIQVTTSISVRSNTAPSTPVQAVNAVPLSLGEGQNIVEKVRSQSPLPYLPTLSNMATSRFMASQRPPRGSRLSAWIHGFSVVNDDRRRPPPHNRKTSHTHTYCYSRTPRRRDHDRVTGLRPVNSTRGVIDPVHSPSHGTFPVLAHTQGYGHPQRGLSTYDGYPARLVTNTGHSRSETRHQRTRTKQVHKKGQQPLLVDTSDPRIKWKIIGSLISGTILAILLTTCTPPFPPHNFNPH